MTEEFFGMDTEIWTSESADVLLIYFFMKARRLCRHLEKLDGLPLDEDFDFRTFLDRKEFLYLGRPSEGSGLWTDRV